MLAGAPKSIATQSCISAEVNLSRSDRAAFFCSNPFSLGDAKKFPFNGTVSLPEKIPVQRLRSFLESKFSNTGIYADER